jgi:hypothetical protein
MEGFLNLLILIFRVEPNWAQFFCEEKQRIHKWCLIGWNEPAPGSTLSTGWMSLMTQLWMNLN